MINKLIGQIKASPTAYHLVDTAARELVSAGFRRLEAGEKWRLAAGDRAFVVVDGSALIAFCIGECEHYAFNIVASHTDSPCFKVKTNPTSTDASYKKLVIEEYGKSLHYTWFDRPLGVAGRLIVRDKKSGALRQELVAPEQRFVIPSLAIHLNRDVNRELKLNIRKDLVPLVGANDGKDFFETIFGGNSDFEIVDFDLFVYSAAEPFVFGTAGEFLCAPRLDNQVGAFGSIQALIDAQPKGVSIAFLADNEEVGSSTKQGAGATILVDVISRINAALGFDNDRRFAALADSFLVSCDNAHASHPNYAEMSDDSSRNFLNKGVVIKHHASMSYTTDGFSSAIMKQICKNADAPFQDFFNRSDLPSGGTLGAISSRRLSIRAVDIGLPQLAMHSTAETLGTKDYPTLITTLTQFYKTKIKTTKQGIQLEN